MGVQPRSSDGVAPSCRFQLFDVSGGSDQGVIVVDPFAVTAVIEERRRMDRGGFVYVATIRLVDGAEYVVHDDGRTAATDIWLGKSIVA